MKWELLGTKDLPVFDYTGTDIKIKCCKIMVGGNKTHYTMTIEFTCGSRGYFFIKEEYLVTGKGRDTIAKNDRIVTEKFKPVAKIPLPYRILKAFVTDLSKSKQNWLSEDYEI